VLATHKIQITRSWILDLLLITLVLGTFYMLWLGSHALFTPDEGRYSEVAREMVATGDYITPRLNGVAFLDKPVLYYWLQASAIKLFGLKEWALRFWPTLMGLFGCIITYLAGRLLYSRRTGILAAIVLAINPLYYGAAHYANLDLEVAVLIASTLFFTLLALKEELSKYRTLFLFLAYILAGLAALTKGLIGLAFPIMILGSWIVILHRWRILLKMHLITGLIIFFAVAAPWYWLVQQANPQFFHFFFVMQQLQRFLTQAYFNNATPMWFYLPIVLAGFLPWSVFLLQALTRQIKCVIKNRYQHPIELFLLLWCIIVFVFFSIPKSKTIGYILPLFPALALIVGNYLDHYWEKPQAKGILLGSLSFILLSIVVVIICLLAPHIQTWGVAAGLVPYLYIIAALFLIGGLYISYLFRKNNVTKLFACLTLISAGFLLVLQPSAAIINQKTIKPLALQLKSIAAPQDEVVTFYKYYQDLPIYLERRITIVADWHASDISHNDNWLRELWFGMPFQDTSAWLIEEPTFWQRWNSQKRVFVLMNAQDYIGFSKKADAKAYKLGEYNGVALVSNKDVIASPAPFAGRGNP
jgi:4-amino-4-deoxy-L-arabinose transferase-like glycosyltransferase